MVRALGVSTVESAVLLMRRRLERSRILVAAGLGSRASRTIVQWWSFIHTCCAEEFANVLYRKALGL